MPLSIRQELDSREALAWLRGTEARCDNLVRPLGRLGLHMQRKNTAILRSGERGIKSTRDSGLAAAQTFRVTPPATLDVGANKPYAASTNYGPQDGRYYPVTCEHLAIPILDGLTATGRAKYASPRDIPGVSGIVGFSKRGNILIGQGHGITKTGRQRTRSRFKGTTVKGSLLEQVRIFFVLVDASPQDRMATAYRWCTFDPPDKAVADQYFADWIQRGR